MFRFDRALASTSAEEFVSALLAERIGAAAVVTGDDLGFGKGRAGNIQVLKELGARHDIAAEAVAPVLINGERVSSGRIRAALQAGDPGTATRLLTRPFAIEGVVEPGDRRGRELGYPTANVALGDYLRPAYGIYAVRMRIDEDSDHPGVASLGIRPTFEPPVELLEAHAFDIEEDLYGRTIEVDLLHYLRPEKKFDAMDALVAEMRADEAEARRLLAVPE